MHGVISQEEYFKNNENYLKLYLGYLNSTISHFNSYIKREKFQFELKFP